MRSIRKSREYKEMKRALKEAKDLKKTAEFKLNVIKKEMKKRGVDADAFPPEI